ncbi:MULTISPECIES: hypothetical protein [unclassified Fusibacter]|uniref:hypothetical protein n=1 Tax=unclassified Fusibacter TaxID=2624464 RepID=UPI001011CD84|nr:MULTISPECIES: hypothetical protein [unclassified Fusibacter]MCK8061612.1 hypothetical protein [Fusibacter sp. A2]NPE23795.1 hypothetical protein [Fusibacter sp. A1]RXV58700.1 hypothetical protein DWB64_18580 [Fusibacter sp. A1]
MIGLIKKIRKKIQRIDFEGLWPGFIPYEFALYSEDAVYLNDVVLPWDASFAGDTGLFFEGRFIAILKVSEKDMVDLDVLTARIVGTMFTTHQLTASEDRYYCELKALEYPYDFDNLESKYAEHCFLTAAYRHKEHSIKRELLVMYMYSKSNRKRLIGEMLNYEKSVQSIEGSVEYVSLKVLKTLSPQKYQKRIAATLKWLDSHDEKLIDTRRSACYSGALLCEICDELGIEFRNKIGSSENYIFDVVFDKLQPEQIKAPMSPIYLKGDSKRILKKHFESIQSEIYDVETHFDAAVVKGHFQIRAYDPLNMTRFVNKTLHRSYVGLYDGNEMRIIKGPVVVYSKDSDFSVVVKYVHVEG